MRRRAREASIVFSLTVWSEGLKLMMVVSEKKTKDGQAVFCTSAAPKTPPLESTPRTFFAMNGSELHVLLKKQSAGRKRCHLEPTFERSLPKPKEEEGGEPIKRKMRLSLESDPSRASGW